MSDFETPHTVAVSTLTGSGGLGSTYADPVEVPCFADEVQKLVRSAGGAQVVSTATLYVTDTTQRSRFAPGSRVVLPSGRRLVVATVADADVDDPDVDHLEVSLT